MLQLSEFRMIQWDIQVKRVYDKATSDDGVRFLVDGLWPRGVAKSALRGVEWVKEIAPSAGLRKWYGHDAEKWGNFRSAIVRNSRRTAWRGDRFWRRRKRAR